MVIQHQHRLERFWAAGVGRCQDSEGYLKKKTKHFPGDSLFNGGQPSKDKKEHPKNFYHTSLFFLKKEEK